jgi:chemotaxis protein histidine kinase CheA
MYDIFLSYSSKDRESLAMLVEVFRQQGWTVFWDHQSVPVGKTYAQYIEDGLRDSTCVVVAWSEHSIKSKWVREEANKAQKREVMLPIRLDRNDPPFGFSEYQAADFSQWQGDTTTPEFQALAMGIREHLNAAQQQAERLAKQNQLTQQQDELTRLQTELQQQQQTLRHAQTQLAEQRELLELRTQAAQQKERERQIQFAQQTEEAQQLAASKQAELTRQTLEFQQQRAKLEQQLQAAKQAGQSEPELVAAQQRIMELKTQLDTAREQAQRAEQQAAAAEKCFAEANVANQTAQQQLTQQQTEAQAQQAKLTEQLHDLEAKRQALLRQAATDKQELTRQQTELKQQQQRVEKAEQAHGIAEQAQAAAEKARQLADKNRQIAEANQRAAEGIQQTQLAQLTQKIDEQHSELAAQQNQLTEKQREISALQQKPSKDKLLGMVGGVVLAGVFWGVVLWWLVSWGGEAKLKNLPQTASTPSIIIESSVASSAPIVNPPVAKPVEDKNQQRLAAIQHAKDVLNGKDKTQWQAAAQALADPALAPLDSEAMFLLGMSYQAGIQGQPKNFAQACPWYQRAAKAGNQKAIVHLQQLRKEQKCKK